MIYKAVPGPKQITIQNDDLSMATNAYAEIINANATNGWRYHSLETIKTTETVKSGCAFNEQTTIVEHNIYMLIFEKDDSAIKE